MPGNKVVHYNHFVAIRSQILVLSAEIFNLRSAGRLSGLFAAAVVYRHH
ncbi:hypothetical protein BN1221_01199c [Brenneria goodwinii]|nr:hypothetical protein BN1221_01199c [Brenneria goodwinii]